MVKHPELIVRKVRQHVRATPRELIISVWLETILPGRLSRETDRATFTAKSANGPDGLRVRELVSNDAAAYAGEMQKIFGAEWR